MDTQDSIQFIAELPPSMLWSGAAIPQFMRKRFSSQGFPNRICQAGTVAIALLVFGRDVGQSSSAQKWL